MRTLRLVLAVAMTMAVAAFAIAMPTYSGVVASTYKLKSSSPIGKLGCAMCHVGMTTKMNPYGADLKKAEAALKVKTLTAAVLKKVEALDSDKDGAKNGAEIKAGTNPGDPKSKPGGAKKK